MKFAYFVRPHIGGTYTVFKQLRKGLAMHGIDVHWLGSAILYCQNGNPRRPLAPWWKRGGR